MGNVTRQHFIPSEHTTIEDSSIPVVVYLHEPVRNGASVPCAMAFVGRKQRPDFHYRFKSIEQRAEWVNQYLEELRKNFAESIKRKEERKAARNRPHTLKVGDVLYSTWGYDQTNVDFYIVTRRVSDRSVEIAEIGSKTFSNDAWCVRKVVADPTAPKGTPMMKRVTMSDGPFPGPRINLTSYSSASLWDGRPITETSYA